MTGPFYNDLMPPFMSVDIPLVTLATTNKALYRPADFPLLGGNFFSYIGKQIRIWMMGRITTAATPGNLQWAIYWGSGADATGTIIQSSAAVALVANGTNLTWELDLTVRCTAIGPTGALFAMGKSDFNVGLVLSTNAPVFIPANTPATSASVDLSASSIVSVQFNRSGSTAETMQVHQLQVFGLN
jgi:hypothetical protein